MYLRERLRAEQQKLKETCNFIGNITAIPCAVFSFAAGFLLVQLQSSVESQYFWYYQFVSHFHLLKCFRLWGSMHIHHTYDGYCQFSWLWMIEFLFSYFAWDEYRTPMKPATSIVGT